MAETRRTETKDGSVVYSWMGKMHCWEGPAYIPQGNKRASEYWLFGFKYTKDQWEERKKDVNGVPFYKTAAAKASGARVYWARAGTRHPLGHDPIGYEFDRRHCGGSVAGPFGPWHRCAHQCAGHKTRRHCNTNRTLQ